MRDDSGRFELKGDEPRILRSIRLTDTCWDGLLQLAESKGCSRSDVLEELVQDGEIDFDAADVDSVRDEIIGEVMEVLESMVSVKESIIKVESRDLASGRRVLEKLIEYLESM